MAQDAQITPHCLRGDIPVFRQALNFHLSLLAQKR
jgi:hypothetical protein